MPRDGVRRFVWRSYGVRVYVGGPVAALRAIPVKGLAKCRELSSMTYDILQSALKLRNR